MIVPETLITTYLHMTDYSQFKSAFVDSDDITIIEMINNDVEFYRFLYRTVGARARDRTRARGFIVKRANHYTTEATKLFASFL